MYYLQDAMDLKITDCRIFNSYNDSGIIVMTTAYRFWIKGDGTINNSPRRLADVPGNYICYFLRDGVLVDATQMLLQINFTIMVKFLILGV